MKSILLSILSALLLILCFPRFDLGFLAWFALIPLLLAIKGKGLKSAFGLCYFTGVFFYWGVFHWFPSVNGVSLIDCILAEIYLPTCYFGLFGLVLNFVSTKTKLPSIVTAPVLWVSLEYARSNAGFLEFPWTLMGHSQYLNLPVIQISAFTGIYGVSFLIIMVNVTISEIILNRSRAFKPTIVTVIILGISFVYGYVILTKRSGRDIVSISVVQGNIPQEIKWRRKFRKQHFERHVRLTKEASNNGNASLIIWPEASVQSLKRNFYFLQNISALARETKTHLLIGSSQRPKSGSKELGKIGKKWFNSACLVSPGGKIMGQYNKIHLLPFAEYLPYKDWFPWTTRFVSKASDFIPGTEYTIFDLDETKFGVTICWENLFPELFRQFVKSGATFMVNITNEAQFGDTEALYHFAVMSVFRAVENRISIVRCANTGISCFINPHGRIMGRVHDSNGKEAFVEGYLTMEVPLSHKKTFYTKYGDVFVYINLIMTAFMLALSFLKGKGLGTKALIRT